jgi:D-alanyl-D-alanine carboxypeptidase (penicillin-binding protein 5/6)
VLVGSGRRNGIQLVSAVLGTPSVAARDAATLKLLAGSFRDFQRITAVRRRTVMTRVPIRYRRGAELPLMAGRTARRIVPRGQRDDVATRLVGVPDDVAGPVVAGQAFGAVEVLQNGRVVGRVPLVAASSVPAADLEQKAKSWFTSPLPLLLLVAAIGGTVLVGRQLRRSVRNGGRTGDRPRAA